MATIRVLKGSRNVEFPEGMTKSELVSIILKWAPRIAGDEDKTPYGIAGTDPSKAPDIGIFDNSFDGMIDMLNEIGENEPE